METDLIARLHNTQAMERAAFMDLEKAMMSSSLPKKERIMIIEEAPAPEELPPIK